jgi:hypothetical protein
MLLEKLTQDQRHISDRKELRHDDIVTRRSYTLYSCFQVSLLRAERSGVPSRKSTRLARAVGSKHPRTLTADADAGELIATVVTSAWAATSADTDLSRDGGCHKGEDG